MNIVETVRVCFSKTGRAKYISHLDLMRTMTRVLRRAQIPLWYTEGFSKHPYITFAAPLSLGYEGLCEYMDFRLEEEMPMEEIVSRLNSSMPEGIVVLSAAPAVMKVGSIASSRWEISLPAELLPEIEKVLARDAIEVQKRTKKKSMKTLDIKPYIADVDIRTEGDSGIVTLTLPMGEQSINPSLLLTAAFGEGFCDAAVTRLAVYNNEGKVFA